MFYNIMHSWRSFSGRKKYTSKQNVVKSRLTYGLDAGKLNVLPEMHPQFLKYCVQEFPYCLESVVEKSGIDINLDLSKLKY